MTEQDDLLFMIFTSYLTMIKFVPIVVKKMIVEKHVPVLIKLILGQLITVGVSLKVLLSLVKNVIKGKVLSLTLLTSQLKWRY
jgi:hypothetical protein